MRRRSPHVLLGVAALLLQLVLPGAHPPHAVPAHDTDEQHAATSITAHDALGCPLCAALAHGRATALSLAPAVVGVEPLTLTLAAPSVPLLAAPAPYRAAPRAPPALA
jgi:hypothetical protein